MTATTDRPRVGVPLGIPQASRAAWLPPAFVILLAMGVRLWNLAGPSLWYDEATTLELASRPVPEIIARTMHDTLPPLSYLVLHAWLALGDGELLWRFPSLWFGVLTVAVVIRIGYVTGGRFVALLAGTALAISPFFVAYSREVRLYGLLGALLAGYLLLSLAGLSVRTLLGAGLLGATALYCHQLSGLVLVLPPLLSLARGRQRDWRPFVPLAIAIALFSPWLTVTVDQGSRVMATFWADPVSPLRPLASLVVFSFGAPADTVALALGAAVVLLLGGLAVLRACRKPLPGTTWYWLALALMPPTVLTALSVIRPIYLDRVLIGAGIAWLLLAAVLVGALERPARLVVVVAWIAAAGLGLYRLLGVPELDKPELRQAAAYVASQARPGDLVLHTSDGSFYPFLIYAPEVDNALLAGDPEYAAGSPRGNWTENVMGLSTVSLDAILKGERRVWVVALLDHSVAWQFAQAGAIDAQLARQQEARFRGVTVRAYAPTSGRGT